MSEFGHMTSHTQIVQYLRSKLDVFYVFSTEIIGKTLYVRAQDCAVKDPHGSEGLAVPLELTICRHTVALGRPLVIDDTHAHPLVKGSDSLKKLGVASYLGVPIFSGETQLSRTLCAMHVRPRQWLDDEVQMMLDAARCSLTLPF